MSKSPDAFRTISEVADWLGIQAHVLRFWESKFSQVKPIKRAGGRRYYRPNDMLLLGGIRQLLHEDGLTIKGVQKILREEGVPHVSGLSQPLDELTQSQVEDLEEIAEAPMIESAEPETAVVLNFENHSAKEEAPEELPFEETSSDAPEPEIVAAAEPQAEDILETAPEPEDKQELEAIAETEIAAEPEQVQETQSDLFQETEPAPPIDAAPEPQIESPEPVAKDSAPAEEPVHAEAEEAPVAAVLPAFLQRPMADAPEPTDNAPAEPEEIEETLSPKPRIIDMPEITPVDQIAASPALLTAVYRTRHLSTDQASQIAPLLDKLTILRDSMAARRRMGTHTGHDA